MAGHTARYLPGRSAATQGDANHRVLAAVEIARRRGLSDRNARDLAIEMERRRWWHARGYRFPDEEPD